MLRCGVGAGPATGLITSFLVLGTGWQNITWAFQLGFMGSAALGLGAMLLALRGTRGTYFAAIALSVLSLTFSGVSLALVAGVGLALALRRQRLRALALVLVCAAVYLAWFALAGRHPAVLPTHVTGRAGRAANVAEWSWETFASAVGHYVSFVSAGSVLILGLLGLVATHLRRHGSAFRLPTTTGAREELVTLSAVTATSVILVLSIAVNRDDITPTGESRYLYFVIALLLPLGGVVLTRAQASAHLFVALLVAYLITTQGLLLVAQVRQLTIPQLRNDTLATARLIADGEKVNRVDLSDPLSTSQDVNTDSIATWVHEHAVGDLTGVTAAQVADARALTQVAAQDQAPPGAGVAATHVAAKGELAAGSCASVAPEPGAIAATVNLVPGQTLKVTLDAAGSLAYRVVDGAVTSRPVSLPDPVHSTRWLTSTAPLTIQILADTGQDETFCAP